MTLVGALSDWVTAAPVAFVLGVLVGLALASRYRIVKLNGRNNENGPR